MIITLHIFKPSGKWYGTAYADMTDYYDVEDIRDAVKMACRNEYAKGSLGRWELTCSLDTILSWEGWSVVCVEPFHTHSHPVMFKGVA